MKSFVGMGILTPAQRCGNSARGHQYVSWFISHNSFVSDYPGLRSVQFCMLCPLESDLTSFLAATGKGVCIALPQLLVCKRPMAA